MITITRIYSDANGESHFEDFEVPLKNNGDIGFLSDDEPVKSIVFREVSPSYDYDFHNHKTASILFYWKAALK